MFTIASREKEVLQRDKRRAAQEGGWGKGSKGGSRGKFSISCSRYSLNLRSISADSPNQSRWE